MCLRISFLRMNKHLKLFLTKQEEKILKNLSFLLFLLIERTKYGSRIKNIGVLLPTKSQMPINKSQS